MNKYICIGGGVGPMAGVYLHKSIIDNTLTNGTDQDHIEVHHFSRSHDINDRTEYLLGRVKENPAKGMFRTVQTAVGNCDSDTNFPVFGVPCNTFHAPKIFNYFLELLDQNNIKIQVLNMISETGNYINKNYPKVKKIGLLTTTGTRKVEVYRNLFESYNFEIIEVPISLQDELHDSIYNKKWGVKAISPISDKAKENFLKYAELLEEKEVELIVLGCTEIPLVLKGSYFKNIPLIDPVKVLARALIRETCIKKLKDP
jgi:aspartate racemase